jgi:hypothetical protein
MDLFLHTFLRFCYTVGVVFLLARFMYYPNKGRKEFLFTYLMLAAIVAQLCLLISRVEISFGFALGIFAIFSLIRYRTDPISARELTYILLCVGIAAKNHLAPDDLEFYKLLVTDALILLLVGALEYFLLRHEVTTKVIVYNNLELIHPDKRTELMADLDARFGISNIRTLKVGKIDVPKNTARLQVTFIDSSKSNFSDD